VSFQKAQLQYNGPTQLQETALRQTIVALLLALATILPATAQQAHVEAPQRNQRSTPPVENEEALQPHRHYRNKDGQDVHGPAKSKRGEVPEGASAQCRDGTYSFSRSRRGTCSHHGGVALWL
jgi:hypothetical protein